MNKKHSIISLFLLMSLVLSACGKEEEKKTEENVAPLAVAVRSVKDAGSLEEVLEFPGLISSEQEARIIAKTGGTVKGFSAKTGDKISANQLLASIDDAKGSLGSGANTSQIRQAQIGVTQAEAALRLAETSYNNTLNQSEKDLLQAEIALGQAGSGKSNLDITSAEAIKSAEIGLEQAKLATANAKANLDKQKRIIAENGSNTLTTSRTNMSTVIDTSNTIITDVNDLTSFETDKGIEVAYRSNLGALDVNSFSKAKSAYLDAKAEYAKVLALGPVSDQQKAEAVIALAQKVKTMSDELKKLFDASISSQSLSEAALSLLKSGAASYQASANNLISIANAAKQALVGTDLSTDLSLYSLEKAYELAQKQEESAKQALESLKAGNKSQSDQAAFGFDSAANQLASTRNRLDLQKQVAKNQVDVARLAYQNAITSLEGLYDIHEAISPIAGTLTQKKVKDGDTVSAGQELAIVSLPERIRIEIFVDEENLKYLKLGDKAEIKDNDGHSYAAKISSLTPQADALSKRYAVEIRPDDPKNAPLALGSIMTAVIRVKKNAQQAGNVILPLSAVEVSQTSNSIFVISEGKAKKVKVEISRVVGEAAEIKTELKPEDQIIIDGIKNVKEGDAVKAE